MLLVQTGTFFPVQGLKSVNLFSMARPCGFKEPFTLGPT